MDGPDGSVDRNPKAEEFSTPPKEACSNPDDKEMVTDDADNRDSGEKNCKCPVIMKGKCKLGFSGEKSNGMVELGSEGKVIIGNVCGVKIQIAGGGNTPEKKRSADSDMPDNSHEKGKKVIPSSCISPKKRKRDSFEADGEEEEEHPSLSLNSNTLPLPAEAEVEVENEMEIHDVNGSGEEMDDASSGSVLTEIEDDACTKEQEEHSGVRDSLNIFSDFMRVLQSCMTPFMHEDGSFSDSAQRAMNIFKLLEMVASKGRQDKPDDEPIDIIETAKKMGIEFPTPRWW